MVTVRMTMEMVMVGAGPVVKVVSFPAPARTIAVVVAVPVAPLVRLPVGPVTDMPTAPVARMMTPTVMAGVGPVALVVSFPVPVPTVAVAAVLPVEAHPAVRPAAVAPAQVRSIVPAA